MKMKLRDIFRLAVLNLWRRWARAILTVTGVIIGTACIVLMISIGLTNLKQFNQQFLDNNSLTTITINNYSYGGGGNNLKLNDELLESIRQMQGVKGVTPQLNFQCYVKAGKYENQWMYVNAVDTAVLQDVFKLQEGSPIDPSAANPQLLVSRWTLSEFMEPGKGWESMEYDEWGNPIPPDIDWLHTPMRLQLGSKEGNGEGIPASRRYDTSIVGILADNGGDFSYGNYMDIHLAKRIFSENRRLAKALNIDTSNYNTAYVFCNTVNDVKSILTTIKSLGLECYSPTEWIDSVMEEQNRQQGQLSAIGMISLLVSAIGIANTMMTSILERRKEIGVLKVVGVSIPRIRLLFLTEAALIGLAGGIAGVLISYGAGMAISSGTEGTTFLGMYFAAGMKLEIPFWLAMSAIGMSVVVGILSGIYPSWRATRISPLEAMRA